MFEHIQLELESCADLTITSITVEFSGTGQRLETLPSTNSNKVKDKSDEIPLFRSPAVLSVI